MAHMHVAGLYARMEKQLLQYQLEGADLIQRQQQHNSMNQDGTCKHVSSEGDADGGEVYAGLKDRWAAVAAAFGRVVLTHVSLLLVTDAHQSATRAAVWRAEHCLKEWDRLARVEVVGMEGPEADQVCPLPN
jgi:hypothetical protein